MAKSANQKLKLLYLMELFKRKSDEDHLVTIADMIKYLDSYGVSAERKSLYDDIEALRLYGLDILHVPGPHGGYYLASREFELPELKLLVDSVQSSRFITEKKTLSLIKKVESLASVHEAAQLHRQVYVSGRIKTMNESIYYNVDEIHSGIGQDRKIAFKYFEYTVTKERRFRRGGEEYCVSPFALSWNSENYYMIAYDSAAEKVKHYRVDKMSAIRVTDIPRDGKQTLAKLDIAEYSGKVFGMFSGEAGRVTLRCAEHLAGAVIDRFGKDVIIIASGDGYFTVTVDVVPSLQFFAWVFGFADEMQILSPASAVEEMRRTLSSVCALYGEDAK